VIDFHLEHALALAALLFSLGIIGLLARKNILFMLMSIEVMLNAAGLAFVAGGARWRQPDGQIMFLFILTMAASEIAVGLALILLMFRRVHSVDADLAAEMRG
jgi:NADH-quinone oxidoreductase subunit K